MLSFWAPMRLLGGRVILLSVKWYIYNCLCYFSKRRWIISIFKKAQWTFGPSLSSQPMFSWRNVKTAQNFFVHMDTASTNSHTLTCHLSWCGCSVSETINLLLLSPLAEYSLQLPTITPRGQGDAFSISFCKLDWAILLRKYETRERRETPVLNSTPFSQDLWKKRCRAKF